MNKFLTTKTLTLFSLIAMLVIVAGATIIEKFRGTSFVASHIYGSWFFIGLWFIIVLNATIYMLQTKMYQRPMVFLIHLSFIVILLGAFVTSTTSVKGTIHLRMGKPVNTFLDKESDAQFPLPFDVTLSNFQVEYYPGTNAPSDYVSEFRIRQQQEESMGRVSMNKVHSKSGYRFYQSGYDRDQQGVLLMIKSDRYGLPITYIGYALLLISMIGFFFSRKTDFRKLLQHPALKRTSVIIVFLMMTGIAGATNPQTLPKESAQKLGELQMLHQDTVCPVQSFAKDFTLKLYGKPSYNGLSAEQVLSGWLFYTDDWYNEPIIKIKDKQVQHILGIEGKQASFTDFFTNNESYKLEPYLEKIYAGAEVAAAKEIIAADEKIQLIYMLRMGNLLKMFPYKLQDNLLWFSSADALPEELPENQKLLILGAFDLMKEYIENNDVASAAMILDKLLIFQKKSAGDMLLSPSKIAAEHLYNRLNFAKPMAMMNLLIGLLALLYFFRRTENSRCTIPVLLNAVLIVEWLLLATVIVLRGYISGRVPMGNGAETMQFLASCIFLLTILFQKRMFLALPFGFIFSGLVLLVSGLGAANPQITHLQPVLMSPLLSIHVSLIMISYTLLGFITLNGLAALLSIIFSKQREAERTQNRILQFSLISRILLYPAVFLLAAGIFVGAVWAEMSWGNYWTWDPKETWALITMIVYGIPLHASIFPRFQQPFFFLVYTVIAFLSVLMTYFGVNILLGGMHSYGGEVGSQTVFLTLFFAILVFVCIPLGAYLKKEKRH